MSYFTNKILCVWDQWVCVGVIACVYYSGGIAHESGVANQLDLPSLTPFNVAGCGRLQLGVPHWATSVIAASN